MRNFHFRTSWIWQVPSTTCKKRKLTYVLICWNDSTNAHSLFVNYKCQFQVELPHMLSTAPNSIPFKLLLHGSQIYRNCEFSKFDYGPGKNFKIYGQAEPPLYNLRNVRAPLHIYYAENDNVVSIKVQFISQIDCFCFRVTLITKILVYLLESATVQRLVSSRYCQRLSPGQLEAFHALRFSCGKGCWYSGL